MLTIEHYLCSVQHFDQQTLIDLEFQQLRNWLTSYTIGETARKRMEQLQPSSHFPTIEKALKQVEELRTILKERLLTSKESINEVDKFF